MGGPAGDQELQLQVPGAARPHTRVIGKKAGSRTPKAPQKQGLGLLQELLRYFSCDFELTAKPQFSPWSWRNPLGPCLFPPPLWGGCCDLVR